MSRPTVSNHEQLDRWVKQLRIASQAAAHRSLIIVQQPPTGWLETYATAKNTHYVSVSGKQDRADIVTGLLGKEHSQLVHETKSAIDAGILAALAGTLKAGGVLVLGMPFNLVRQDNTLTPFAQRFGRLAQQLQSDHPKTAVVLEFKDPSEVPETQLTTLPGIATSGSPHTRKAAAAESALAEQDSLLAEALLYLDQHPHGCVIVTGRRGRGKSMLLARLATLLQKKNKQLRITSAHRSALSTLRRHAPEIDRYFIAAEKLAHNRVTSASPLLLVDEAASLPLGLLTTLIEQHQQVVLCTTVEGYENTGRAFDIRFISQLEKRFDQLLELQPLLPWRWAGDDPLEQFIDRLMLTGSARVRSSELTDDRTPATGRTHEASDKIQTLVRQLDRAALVQDEPLLASVFSLLHEYHYQTSALDLAHMLDAPDLQIWIAEQTDQHSTSVVGAVLLCLEGKIEQALHEPITSKQRRVSHQLLPQLLAQCANRSAGLKESYARVIRVSVKPAFRRQGVATLLLSSIQESLSALQIPINTMGASFADDECTLRFWLANEFTPFHRGFRSNPRTGTHSMAVIRSSNNNVLLSVERAVRIHTDNESWRTANNRNTKTGSAQSSAITEPALLAAIKEPDTSEQFDVELLQRFVNAQRSAHDTAAAIGRLLKAHGIEPVLDESPAGKSKLALTDNVQVASRRQRDAAVRKRIANLLCAENVNSEHPHKNLQNPRA